MLKTKIIETTPYNDQKPGTSGLRKKTSVFASGNYLENYIEAVFETLAESSGKTLVLGGDGRYFNAEAIQVIIKMAAARGFARVLVGQNGILSTPAASCVIRKRGAFAGIVLSASHNPGGPEGDFGVKLNLANGGPAPESVTNAIYEASKKITSFAIADAPDVETARLGTTLVGNTMVEVFDPIEDYEELLSEIFDFGAIAALFKKPGFKMRYDALNAVTGPYAKRILEGALGAPEGTVVNAVPLPDFGGLHPDPNPLYARDLIEKLSDPELGYTFGAASDGDGDRNMIVGRGQFVSPSDSLAVITANARLIPAYKDGIAGVARSMPTSCAVDLVAADLGIPCYETPTGWKFFGNLLDAGKVTICGEESSGTGADHVREKDGLWAVLCWLSIMAATGKSAEELLYKHWEKYGRNFYSRHDYENISKDAGERIMETLRRKIGTLAHKSVDGLLIEKADEFSYKDPVDGSTASRQGIRIFFERGSRIVFRLSGTGTVGATLRVYLERYDNDASLYRADVQSVLLPLITAAQTLAEIEKISGRQAPSVIS